MRSFLEQPEHGIAAFFKLNSAQIFALKQEYETRTKQDPQAFSNYVKTADDRLLVSVLKLPLNTFTQLKDFWDAKEADHMNMLPVVRLQKYLKKIQAGEPVPRPGNM